MDELAAQLSMLSFGIIGVICVIGVIQSRPWLEMFTIGGQYVSSVTSYTLAPFATHHLCDLICSFLNKCEIYFEHTLICL
jgi:hypothetical protein